MSDQIDKFALERASTSLFEAGKKVNTSFLLLSVLLIIASILVFSDYSESKIKVPLLDLTLQRWIAAQVIVALSSAVTFHWISLHSYERLLYSKLHSLASTTNSDLFHWYAFHPTIYFFLEEIGYLTPKLHKFFCGVIVIFAIAGGFLYPLYLMYVIGSVDRFSISWAVSLVVTLFFIGASIATAYTFLSLNLKQSTKLIDNIEKEKDW
jgi:hypothetical protein